MQILWSKLMLKIVMGANYLGLSVLIGLNLSIAAVAQPVTPTIPIQERLPQPTPSILPAQPEPLQTPQVSPTPTIPVSGPERIKVLRYEVLGSTIFSPQELAQATRDFTGEVAFERLQAAKDAIEKLYRNGHYLTSGAYIPTGQTLSIDGAVVRIQVIEGKLEDIKVTGTQRLHPNYVRSRLALFTQQPLNNDRLIEGLRLLQQDPLIENIAAELSSGIQPGTNLLEIKVRERNTFSGELAMNNYRSVSIGSWQRRAQVNQANLTGLGDNLTLAYSNTDGSNTIDASYTVPLNPQQTTLNLNVGGTNSQIIEEPYRSLNISTNSRYYEVGLRHPVVRRAFQDSTQELAVSLTASKLESISALGDIPYPLSRGADDNGRTSATVLRFAQDYVQRDSQSVLVLRSQLNLGIDALDATVNRSGPDGRFVSWQGQGRWLKRLAPNTDLVVSGLVQVADRPLLSLEQFTIGGQNTVRGYRQDALSADNGALATVELQLPIISTGGNVVQVTPFLEAGTVWNNVSNTGINTLLAAGLGLQWRTESLTARLDWGIPLVHAGDRRNSLQDSGIHFSVRYFPF
jgi:hemolysin activation/secretion protein